MVTRSRRSFHHHIRQCLLPMSSKGRRYEDGHCCCIVAPRSNWHSSSTLTTTMEWSCTTFDAENMQQKINHERQNPITQFVMEFGPYFCKTIGDHMVFDKFLKK